jgi:hypothetical protein
MRIYIKNTNLEAFWNHFAPKGLISMYGSIGYCGGQIYLVDLRRWDREYTAEEEAKIWEEVMVWAVHCPI